MALNENIEHISGCFQNLNNEDLKFLNEKKTQINYLKGETIFKQGAFAPHVLFVNSGLVRVYLQTGKEKQINIRLAKKGDFMAFSSIFNKNTYQYSAISLTDSSICMLEKEALKEIILKNPDFSMQITSKNSKNENRYLEIIKNVSFKQMRGKLASSLLYLTSDEFKADKVFQYLTRQDIADFASITVESAVKFLKEFEKESIISLKGKEIFIENKQALNDINMKG
ncbi:Crp/Fnr family transcriptional regulator [Ancylomarina longa]|uniref:Crp/Fnr family transcriptional regulator n=1 Tax=Ancylomarina longa TaxID=2487017 RepID=UPI001F16DB82|nr:Crp/Fnr family transcriptional regulator [Ancylomarina longa]